MFGENRPDLALPLNSDARGQERMIDLDPAARILLR